MSLQVEAISATRLTSSPPAADPWRALAAAMVIHAVDEMIDGDGLSQIDAFLWLMSDQAAPFLDFFGIDEDMCAWLASNAKRLRHRGYRRRRKEGEA